jgi:hypothetical protein
VSGELGPVDRFRPALTAVASKPPTTCFGDSLPRQPR